MHLALLAEGERLPDQAPQALAQQAGRAPTAADTSPCPGRPPRKRLPGACGGTAPARPTACWRAAGRTTTTRPAPARPPGPAQPASGAGAAAPGLFLSHPPSMISRSRRGREDPRPSRLDVEVVGVPVRVRRQVLRGVEGRKVVGTERRQRQALLLGERGDVPARRPTPRSTGRSHADR